MGLKYAADIAGLDECPPSECSCCQRQAFRFVHADIAHPNNFAPPAKISPRRKFDSDDECCSAHALSLFITQEQAVVYYLQLKTVFKNIAKTIGDHVASGSIDGDDGQVTPVGDDGHFDLFEDESADVAPKFAVVGPIA